MPWAIEVIKQDQPRGAFHSALFDFDGTISLIRQGWQDIMVPYFTEVVQVTPGGQGDPDVPRLVREFIDLLTGKQTIYQCIRLAEEVAARGGQPLEPTQYKDEYHRRLLEKIQHRRDDLAACRLQPDDWMVPGARAWLDTLRARGVKCYLASGTDHQYVMEEAALLQLTDCFDGGIYGAQDDFKTFSKAKVIERIIRDNRLEGAALLGFGDGYVEIENVVEVGGYAVGCATDEEKRVGIDEWKRPRLIAAGAAAIIPDFSDTQALEAYFLHG